MKLYVKNAKDCGKYVKGQAFIFLKFTFEIENLQFLAIFCSVEEEMLTFAKCQNYKDSNFD